MHSPGIYPEIVRKTAKLLRIAGLLSEVRTQPYPNTNIERYRYVIPFGGISAILDFRT
jgi:hypothetical protein